MRVLHLDSSILGPGSVSRRLSAEIVSRVTALNAAASVTYRDLAAHPLAHLSGELLAAQAGAVEHAPALQADLAESGAALDEFLAAETVVIGVAFYNFTVATQLKAWIDRIMIAGRTFRYGADGRPEGLAGGKRVILAIARGGAYGAGSPQASAEHAESYLRSAFAFMGVADLEIVTAEGLAFGPEQRDVAITQAELQIAALAA